MLYIVLTAFIMLAILDRTLRGGRVRLRELEFEFKLFALRDRLRDAAIAGDIPYNNWFEYMDTTLTRTLGRMDSLNPWLAVGYVWINRGNTDLHKAYEELKDSISRPENKIVASVYNQYLECLVVFLKARHPLSLPLAAMVFSRLCPETRSKVDDSIEREERDLAPIFSITPETSTLWEHIPLSGRVGSDIHVSEPSWA